MSNPKEEWVCPVCGYKERKSLNIYSYPYGKHRNIVRKIPLGSAVLQVKIDGNTYLVHSNNCVLIDKG